MSHEHDKDPLDRLYGDQSPIEPPAGLDRIIRAQAEQAVELDRRARPRPWMAGLATTAVAVMAVAVVLQTQLPGPTVAEPPPPSIQFPSSEVPERSRRTDVPVERDLGSARSAETSDAPMLSAPRASGAPQALEVAPGRELRRQQSPAPMTAPPAADQAENRVVREEESLMDFEPELAELQAESTALAESLSPWQQLEASIEAGDRETADALLDSLKEAFPGDERLAEFEALIEDMESSE